MLGEFKLALLNFLIGFEVLFLTLNFLFGGTLGLLLGLLFLFLLVFDTLDDDLTIFLVNVEHIVVVGVLLLLDLLVDDCGTLGITLHQLQLLLFVLNES